MADFDFSNIIFVSQVTLDDVARMQELLDSGDRGAAYMYYYYLLAGTLTQKFA